MCIPTLYVPNFLLAFSASCVSVRDALLPLLHSITGGIFFLNYYPCVTLRRTTGRACGFLLVLKMRPQSMQDRWSRISLVSVPSMILHWKLSFRFRFRISTSSLFLHVLSCEQEIRRKVRRQICDQPGNMPCKRCVHTDGIFQGFKIHFVHKKYSLL